MPRAKKQTYYVEVTGSIEVSACFHVEAVSEEEALGLAEDMFESNVSCSIQGADDISLPDVRSLDSSVVEEE